MATGGGDLAAGTGGLGQLTPALPPQDLTRDPLISNAPRATVAGLSRPTLGGIPLLTKIGRGGMGAVYYAINLRLQREVAVKVLPFHIVDQDPDAVQRFFREAQSAARVRSPHLVDVFDVDQDSGIYYLVMEFVRGLSAGSYLRTMRAPSQTGISESSALDIAIAATHGLAAAHAQGIIHRDIKPDNILIPMRAGTEQLDFAASKLADLGLARSEQSGQTLTGSAQCLGTPGYLSPEQARDAKSARKPADVFSMGATLYALLAGQAPFAGQTLMQILRATTDTPHRPVQHHRPTVSVATAELIDRCLSKDPARRYLEAAALLAALQACRAALSEDDLCASTLRRTPMPVAVSVPSSTLAPDAAALDRQQCARRSSKPLAAAAFVALIASAGFYPWLTKAPEPTQPNNVAGPPNQSGANANGATPLGAWQGKALSVEFRLGEDAPADGLIEMRAEPSGNKVYLHPRVELTDADIAHADVWTIPGHDNAAVGIGITLTEQGKERLATLTRNHVKKKLCILVNNKLLSAATINEAILDGRALLSGMFTPDEAEKIAEQLRNK